MMVGRINCCMQMYVYRKDYMKGFGGGGKMDWCCTEDASMSASLHFHFKVQN